MLRTVVVWGETQSQVERTTGAWWNSNKETKKKNLFVGGKVEQQSVKIV